MGTLSRVVTYCMASVVDTLVQLTEGRCAQGHTQAAASKKKVGRFSFVSFSCPLFLSLCLSYSVDIASLIFFSCLTPSRCRVCQKFAQLNSRCWVRKRDCVKLPRRWFVHVFGTSYTYFIFASYELLIYEALAYFAF